MAARRGGLGKGLDSLIPRKIKRLDFEEENLENSENEFGDQEPLHEDDPEQEEEVDDEVNPFSLEGEDEDDYEEDEEDIESETVISEESDDDNQSSIEESPEEAFEHDITEENNTEKEEIINTDLTGEASAEAENDTYGEELRGTEEAAERESRDTDEENAVIMMRTSMVEPNRQQPRKKFNDTTIEALAESIRLYGVIQPLLVQKREDYYEIVAGERRWRAAKKAGLKEIPVIVREYSSQEAAEIALIENIQREDLNPIEEAQAYDRLIREFSLTQEEVATKVARSRSAITNSLRLLRLCEDVRDMVIRGEISEGHARAILALPSSGHQKMLADQVVSDKLSVRETEKLIRKIMKPAKETSQPDKDLERQAALGKLSENLTNVYGTRVQVSGNAKGKGKIEINFYSDEELERIYELLLSVQ